MHCPIGHDVSLKEILAFFTGTDSIPPLGFGEVTLSFSKINAASTCAVELTLPSGYTDYDIFAQKCAVAFKRHCGFFKI